MDEVCFSRGAPTFSLGPKNRLDIFRFFSVILQTSAFSDFTIHNQNETIKAHRAILAASSGFFKSLLLDADGQAKCDVSSHSLVMPSDVLHYIMKYMYEGRLDHIDFDMAGGLEKAARSLDIPDIVEACKKTQLAFTDPSVDNCLTCWQEATELNDQQLADKFSEMALSQFKTLRKYPAFFELSPHCVQTYLSHDKLASSNPTDLFSAALAWVKKDTSSRRQHLPSILKTLPLQRMSGDLLSYCMEEDPVLSEDPQSLDVLQHAVTDRAVSVQKKDDDDDDDNCDDDDDDDDDACDMSHAFASSASEESHKVGAVRHSWVCCDECEKTVCGVRYKCGNCPDYDLCGDCEAGKSHGHDNDHVFLKIRNPVSRVFQFELLKCNLYRESGKQNRFEFLNMLHK